MMEGAIDDRYLGAMNRVTETLDRHFNAFCGEKRVGFVLLIAEFDQINAGRVHYISNANRSDMIAMMKEFIARAEGRYVDPAETTKQ